MNNFIVNPFEITKAVDFTDQQINDYWVDIAGAGFHDTIKPSSPMPMMILGGKGSGKTHIMRYFTYSSQKLRHKNVVDGVINDRYIGIYVRCGGLNSNRFGVDEKNYHKWLGVFSYYMDLWLAQHTLKIIMDILNESGELIQDEGVLSNKIINLFSVPNKAEKILPKSLVETLEFLIIKQREIDIAVNNYPFSESLDVDIAATPGELVFAIPKILCEHIDFLNGVMFTYFIDEFENLTEHHQKYVNTLVREKELPCTFKIGSRLYGVKTYETYSAGEVNKAGSEYEPLYLDYVLRNQTKQRYREFGKSLCLRRLAEANYIFSDDRRVDGGISEIDFFFETYPRDRFAKEATKFILNNYEHRERPYVVSLKKNLMEGVLSSRSKQIGNNVNKIINNILVYDNPVLEKANIYLLYQDWSAGKDLLASSKQIKKESDSFIKNDRLGKRLDNVLSHFSVDFIAQIMRESGRKQIYLGMDSFIDMSSGLPRNLLIILKHIFQWSLYNGERPFIDNRKISMQAQRKGLMEAVDWFFRDARITGLDGKIVRGAVSNIATLLRRIRFSDKPPECSLSTFSVDAAKLTYDAQRMIEMAENYSLLINIAGGRRDRNTSNVNSKYQINPMLAPRWDLPISRRGDVSLSADEANAIFDPGKWREFEKYSNLRVGRMTAPEFKLSKSNFNSSQGILPGFEDV